MCATMSFRRLILNDTRYGAVQVAIHRRRCSGMLRINTERVQQLVYGSVVVRLHWPTDYLCVGSHLIPIIHIWNP